MHGSLAEKVGLGCRFVFCDPFADCRCYSYCSTSGCSKFLRHLVLPQTRMGSGWNDVDQQKDCELIPKLFGKRKRIYIYSGSWWDFPADIGTVVFGQKHGLNGKENYCLLD